MGCVIGKNRYNKHDFNKCLDRAENDAYYAYRLANHYWYGTAVGVDHKKYVEYLQLATSLGNVSAKTDLAHCLTVGLGVEKNPQHAVALYAEASAKGCDNAQCALASMYYHGIGIPLDYEKAFDLYTKSSATNAVAMRNLGTCYRYGKGVAIDRDAAFKWYEKAYQSGDTSACYELAECLRLGIGCKADPAKADAIIKGISPKKRKELIKSLQMQCKALEQTPDYLKNTNALRNKYGIDLDTLGVVDHLMKSDYDYGIDRLRERTTEARRIVNAYIGRYRVFVDLNSKFNTCVICGDETEYPIIFGCFDTHIVCDECLKGMAKHDVKKCPVCRALIHK